MRPAGPARSAVGGRAPGTQGPVLEVENLVVRFNLGRTVVRAVNGVSFSVRAGSTLALIGESGSGKSVTVRAVIGLLPEERVHVQGSVRLLGREVLGLADRDMRRYRGAAVALVPQDPSRSLDPVLRVGTQIAEAVRVHRPLSRRQARSCVLDLLERVRMPSPRERMSEYPHQLSGGMRQRVVLAIALASEPDVLIADEATTALDVTTQEQIMQLLLELRQETGMAVVLVSHDMGIASMYADEVVVMYAGNVLERASSRGLFSNARVPYTRALLDAIPDIDAPPHTRLRTVGGRPPDPTDLPDGCPYAARCERSDRRCVETPPPLSLVGDHAFACHHPIVLADESAPRLV